MHSIGKTSAVLHSRNRCTVLELVISLRLSLLPPLPVLQLPLLVIVQLLLLPVLQVLPALLPLPPLPVPLLSLLLETKGLKSLGCRGGGMMGSLICVIYVNIKSDL